MPVTKNIQAIWNQSFPTQDAETSLQSIAEPTKYIVVYFYPKDNTPGCTNETIDFQAQLAKFKTLNTAIVGVSRDSVGSHQKFATKLELAFPLISDQDEIVCKAFNVIKEKNMYGKIGFGIERSTFILDDSGKILKEWRKVKVDGHVEEVIEAVQAL